MLSNQKYKCNVESGKYKNKGSNSKSCSPETNNGDIIQFKKIQIIQCMVTCDFFSHSQKMLPLPNVHLLQAG